MCKFSTKSLAVFTTIVFAVVIQCHAQQPTASPDEVKNGEITGRVVNDSGQPLTGATVQVRSASIINIAMRTAQTNADGNFQVNGLETGLYYVSASSPPYVGPVIDPAQPPQLYRVGDSVRLELMRGGVITGTVTNGNEEPVIGVRVRAMIIKDAAGKDMKGRMWYGERQSDDRGIYRIYGLVPGTYVVYAGGGGSQFNSLNATDLDAPTYAPSSTRDTATEIQVRSGEETTIDIRYRYELGHTISGTVKSSGTSGVSITLSYPNNAGPFANSYQSNGTNGFSFNGIADGEYTVMATEVLTQIAMKEYPDIALSDPIRVTVKGGDVTGIELQPKPMASIAGRISLEASTVPDCQNKRRPLFAETMVSLIQNRKDSQIDQLALMRATMGVGMATKDGTFVIKNLQAGQYAWSPKFSARYWYLKSISLGTPGQKDSAGSAKDATRNWTTLKNGDRLTGLLVTLSEGAASIRGQLQKDEAATLSNDVRVYLVPSERERVDEPLYYFTAEVDGEGAFLLSNIPPGKYWTLVQQPQAEMPSTTEKLRLPDAVEARTKLRKAAEVGKSEVELKPCQNVTGFKIRPS